MILATRARLALAAAGLAMAIVSTSAMAQDISESHLKAAYAAIDAIGATDQFDAVLPQAARALKGELIQKDPNLTDLIDATVEKNALALASRRADLEKEAAMAYARVFSEEELKAIAEFYNSPTGKKLLEEGPNVTREVLKAEQIWQRGVARDLAQNTGKEIADKVGTKTDEGGTDAGATDAGKAGEAKPEGDAKQ
jgi:hypothetical protein